jgi:hypothetical protein
MLDYHLFLFVILAFLHGTQIRNWLSIVPTVVIVTNCRAQVLKMNVVCTRLLAFSYAQIKNCNNIYGLYGVYGRYGYIYVT